MRLFLPLISASFLFVTAGFASAQTGFETDAPHAIILDHDSGIVLYEKDARNAVAPASMTKIMTADLVFDQIKSGRLSLSDTFPVSEDAWRRGGVKSGSSTMFLKVHSKVSVEDLLRGVIIQSGNDACIALAQGIAGSEDAFANMMTERARALGLQSATFKNSTGWPHPEHKISTYDLARLASHSIESYPEFYPIYSERSFTWNGIKQGNRNPLLGAIDGADGLKTGHTEASGYGLVGTAIRDGKRRIIVINGLESKAARRNTARQLMSAAFSRFEILNIRKKGDVAAELDVYLGSANSVKALVPYDISLGVARANGGDNIKVQMRHPKELVAPIAKGQQIGELTISRPGTPPQIVPLLAQDDVAAKKGISRAIAVLKKKIGGA